MKDALLRYSRTLARDRETAKDLASEAILIAYENFSSMRTEAALRSYLFTTVYRLARKDWKRNDRHSTVEHAETLHSTDVAPDVLADIRLLQEALDKLPEQQCEAVVLFEVAGLQLSEIQEIQGGSLSAVKMRIVRGRDHLKELLGEPKGQARTAKRNLDQLSTYNI